MLVYKKSTIYRTILLNIKKADSFGTRLKGLMFKRTPLKEEGLWIIPCDSIHMFFMSFSIDAVFLNKENEIIKLVKNLKPWRVVMPVKNSFSVLELPEGAIEQYSLKIGERLALS